MNHDPYTEQEREEAATVCAILASTYADIDPNSDQETDEDGVGLFTYLADEAEEWALEDVAGRVQELALAAYAHAIEIVPSFSDTGLTPRAQFRAIEARANGLAEAMIRKGWCPGDLDDGIDPEHTVNLLVNPSEVAS